VRRPIRIDLSDATAGALMDVLFDCPLSGSDTAALGGDLAYRRTGWESDSTRGSEVGPKAEHSLFFQSLFHRKHFLVGNIPLEHINK
jgi:hypothetical protein